MKNSQTKYIPPSQRSRRRENQTPASSLKIDEDNFPQLQSVSCKASTMDYSVITKKEEDQPENLLVDVLPPGWIQITCNKHNRPIITGNSLVPPVEDEYDLEGDEYLNWLFTRHEMERQDLIDSLGYAEYKRLYVVEFPEIEEEDPDVEYEEEEYTSEEEC